MQKILPFICFIILQFICFELFADNQSIYLNMDYQKNVKIESYVVLKSQLCELFTSGKIIQPQEKDLYGNEKYLLIRTKNVGQYVSWGKLSCKVERHKPIEIEILMMKNRMDHFNDHLTPIPDVFQRRAETLPSITCEWIELYTY